MSNSIYIDNQIDITNPYVNKKQKQIIEFISQYIQSEGHSPTLQEIADAMGLSSLATVHEHLKALENKGIIKRYNLDKDHIKYIVNFLEIIIVLERKKRLSICIEYVVMYSYSRSMGYFT